MLTLQELTEADKGREVRYTTHGSHGSIEYGRITSWNDHFVFVRYHLRVDSYGKQHPRYGDTSEATRPEDLEFTC